MDEITNTIEETLKKIKESFPDVDLDKYKSDLAQYFNDTTTNFTTSFYIYIRKLFLYEYYSNTYGAIDEEDKKIIDTIIKDALLEKDLKDEIKLEDELNRDIEKLKIYNYIKTQVNSIDENYGTVDYQSIIERLVEKYLKSDKSYEELQEEIDAELNEIMTEELKNSKDKDALYTALGLNTDNGDIKYDDTKAVNIANIFRTIEENPTLTEEEKQQSFDDQMKNVIIPYIEQNIGEDFVVEQLTTQYKDILNGTEDYTLEELLTYPVMKKIVPSLDKKEGFFTTEVNTRLFSTIDDEEELITLDGEFNKHALNFEGLDEFYNLRAKDDPEFKIESILWFQFIPKKLIEALKTVKEEEKSSVVLDFIKFYLSELNKYFEEKGISVTLTLEEAFKTLNDEEIPVMFQGQKEQFSDWKHLVAGEIDKVESMTNEEKEQEQDLNSPLEMTEEELKDIDEHIKNGTMIKDNPKTLVYQQMNTAVDNTRGTSNTVLIYAMFGLSILLTIFIWVVVMIYR